MVTGCGNVTGTILAATTLTTSTKEVVVADIVVMVVLVGDGLESARGREI